MCLISPPQSEGGLVNTRMFIPHVCHDAIGVLAAVSVATACILPNSVAKNVAILTRPETIGRGGNLLPVEHPTGEFSVQLESYFKNGHLKVEKSGVMRTARLLSKGVVFIP